MRSFSFWVVTPTGQLFVWQMRAMMHPSAIMAIVPNLGFDHSIIPQTKKKTVRTKKAARGAGGRALSAVCICPGSVFAKERRRELETLVRVGVLL